MAYRSCHLPTEAISRYRSLHATIEHVDDAESDFSSYPYSNSSTPDLSTTPTRSSFVDDGTENAPEDLAAALCRRDFVHTMAINHWGLAPPNNFAQVTPGIFRCAYPKPPNFPFLKALGLKSILTLVSDPYSDEHMQFVTDNGIQHFQLVIEPNKDPFVTISQSTMHTALGVVLDRANHPILIHCNKGKHRTGCVVGCLRKLMGWNLQAIYDEYRRHAEAKARPLDERFIESFDERALLWQARNHAFVPPDEPLTECPISSLAISTRLRG